MIKYLKIIQTNFNFSGRISNLEFCSQNTELWSLPSIAGHQCHSRSGGRSDNRPLSVRDAFQLRRTKNLSRTASDGSNRRNNYFECKCCGPARCFRMSIHTRRELADSNCWRSNQEVHDDLESKLVVRKHSKRAYALARDMPEVHHNGCRLRGRF